MRLHIGGTEPHPDWKILDIEARPEVDYVANASDLSQFEDKSIEVIYASHVLEHFSYKLENELIETLKEWYRVLQPGGELLISVPDLKSLCWLYTRPDLTYLQRHKLMEIMFGGQTDSTDVHKVGFDNELIAMYLGEAGFPECERVAEFNLFDDSSSLRVWNILISLNIVARK